MDIDGTAIIKGVVGRNQPAPEFDAGVWFSSVPALEDLMTSSTVTKTNQYLSLSLIVMPKPSFEAMCRFMLIYGRFTRFSGDFELLVENSQHEQEAWILKIDNFEIKKGSVRRGDGDMVNIIDVGIIVHPIGAVSCSKLL